MDKSEIAMQITLKAMGLNLIPYSAITSASDVAKIDSVIEFNSSQITSFYSAVLDKLPSST